MTREEKDARISKAAIDLNEAQLLLFNFNYEKYQAADDFIQKCSKDQDYSSLIHVNRLFANLCADVPFAEMTPLAKRRLLRLVKDTLQEYISIIGTEPETPSDV